MCVGGRVGQAAGLVMRADSSGGQVFFGEQHKRPKVDRGNGYTTL